MNIFGENVKRFRLVRGLSQTELSKKTGISQAMISQIEKGRRETSGESREKLAKALSVSLFWLFKPVPKLKSRRKLR